MGQVGAGNSRFGFATVKAYRKSSLFHTLHILRIETERQLAGRIELVGLNNESEEEIRERLLRMHEVELNKKRKAQCYAYLEIMGYYQDKRLVKKFMKMLEKKFNADVFGVIHHDENSPHVHVIVSWRDRRGKAIRLQRGDFNRLWRQAIEVMQPSREVAVRKGMGRRSIRFYEMRKYYLRGEWDKIINYLRVETLLYQEALRAVGKCLDEDFFQGISYYRLRES